MRVLVCGGRTFNDYAFLDKSLSEVLMGRDVLPLTIIQGGARGADWLAADWAERQGVDLEEYPANWDMYGKSAGYIRNAQMLREGKPDLVVAFPGGRGTDMMCELAAKAGVEVVRFYPNPGTVASSLDQQGQ